ncbi:Per1-like protein [Metschnikowia bicuspidata var. bicuspidata NRRL YB-4993]|uniref:Post-GPI attachment to proteins factor 3 n=1 Tax=Metschnikowia bicuspidata var. bicuspidata NRRL YB-4993 TaxID=869754 RepID=A0A1A0HBU4_9ASCO|nr:Per1-like protein [Metschnikowia bicuspidata var. bicuspidata NRRL YB-4993]OBA21347.1 Per1-like protein [Metschnikowia bicuspidata var. bicuspidata NRRL YB-4993]
MRFPYLLLLVAPLAHASIGDRLPEFALCVKDCEAETCSTSSPSLKYLQDSVNPLSAILFAWDCPLDCNYKCQQKVTRIRQNAGLDVVQFYGKWPFRRVLGVTELFSTVFSMANLYVNYGNLPRLLRHYRANKSTHPEKACMLFQYLVLLVVSIAGWTGSSVFHIRDFPATEALDYLGASAMSVANFNAIFVRYFGLFRHERRRVRRLVHIVLTIVLLGHYLKFFTQWNYTYNMQFNVFFGLAALSLWILHSLDVNRKYRKNAHIYSNSMHLLPHETRILAHLNHVGLSRSRYVPLVPVGLNLYILLALLLEMVDFEPWFLLIDAHSLWHLCTIIPPIIWYDWNVWDLELASKTAGV